MQDPAEDRSAPKPFLFLLFSLLFHALLILCLSPLILKPRVRPSEQVIEVSLVPQPREIADIPPPKKEETPEEAKLAALYNQKVAKETVAPSTPGANGAPASSVKTPPKEKAEAETKSPEKTENREKGASLEKSEVEKTKPEKTKTPSQNPPKTPSESTPPSLDARFGSPDQSQEFFPDFARGGHTYVNTLRYPNLAYFVELKRRFRAAFNPVSTLRRHMNEIPGRTISTVLGVSVNPRGELIELFVHQGSGLSAYDEYVEKIIRESAPFSSPPPQLLEKDRTLRMSWTFTVYL